MLIKALKRGQTLLRVPLSAQPTCPATLHSEFPKAREYNSNCEIRSLNALGEIRL